MTTQETQTPMKLIAEMMEELESNIDAYGWDQPDSLWMVRWEDEPTSRAVLHRRVIESHVDLGVLSLEPLVELKNTLGELTGQHAPEDAYAVVLSCEGWAYPEDEDLKQQIVSPSDHPRRVELRVLVGMNRTGAHVRVTRKRGSRPEASEESLSGTVSNALRCYLQAATQEVPPCTPRQALLQRSAIILVEVFFASLAQEDAPELGSPECQEMGKALVADLATLAELGEGEGTIPEDSPLPEFLVDVFTALTPEVTWVEMRQRMAQAQRDMGDDRGAQVTEWMDDVAFASMMTGLDAEEILASLHLALGEAEYAVAQQALTTLARWTEEEETS